jgi:hypothetical protein
MLLAVATIISHNTIAHHHHEEIKPFVHHDHETHHDNHSHDYDSPDDNVNGHNVFSFAQLDEDFLPAKYGKLSIELPVIYLLTPVITFELIKLHVSTKTLFGYYREYPPPVWSSHNLFSRPPPVC